MSQFQDRFGFYHDKDVGDQQLPSSNNGWIYTAYAKQLGLYVPGYSINQRYLACLVREYPLLINRLPNKKEPPMSRDEILGMVSLGVMPNYLLEPNYYQYYNPMNITPKPWYKLNYIKAIKDFWYLKDKHRNTIWEEGRFAAYPFAFRLPVADVYYVRKRNGQAASIYQTIFFWLASYVSAFSKKDERSTWSSQNITWLKMKDLGYTNNFIFKKLDRERAARFLKYFGSNHPFVTLEDEL